MRKVFSIGKSVNRHYSKETKLKERDFLTFAAGVY